MASWLIFLISLYATKLTSSLISILHLGQASTFPGKIAISIKKDILKDFKFQNNSKIILITGTNGKSTTCGLLAAILKAAHKKVIYNKSGANLISGIVSTLCHYSNLSGKVKYDYLIFEVDEATLPVLTSQINPSLIAVTNFFRDQLDRFGELDTTVKLIEKGINNSKDSIVVLNADDVRVAAIKTENKKIFYGISNNKSSRELRAGSWESDPEENTTCPNCKSNLIFNYKLLAHLGDYRCDQCNFKRPEINFSISDFKFDNLTCNFDLMFNNQRQNFFFPMIGIFNLYNALCAITIANLLEQITQTQIQKAFQAYSTIFGRGEKIKLNNKNAWVYLIKNPSGTTEVLKTLKNIPNARFLIAINDNYADGRDVSWLWDAHFDILSNHKETIFISGKRAKDMALRLKYANINENQIYINENIIKSLEQATKDLKENETLYILPTYTVLLEMQRKKVCKGQPL